MIILSLLYGVKNTSRYKKMRSNLEREEIGQSVIPLFACAPLSFLECSLCSRVIQIRVLYDPCVQNDDAEGGIDDSDGENGITEFIRNDPTYLGLLTD